MPLQPNDVAQYRVEMAESTHGLEADVNSLIQFGWELYGNPIAIRGMARLWHVQAMIRRQRNIHLGGPPV